MNGDPYDDTKSKYKDLEVRTFNTSEAATLFISKLYKQTK